MLRARLTRQSLRKVYLMGTVQAKEEKQAKRAKLASKSKLSFADDEEEDEVKPQS